MKSILLVNPQYELEIRWIADERQIDVKADYFPLGLATVAALTPEGYRADIWDELVRGPVEQAALPRTYDLVGVTSHRSNLDRAFAISDYFRAQGVPVAVGGPGVSGAPDRCRGRFDFLLLGECEHLWPRFLREWAAGCARSEYRQIEKPDLTASPLPKWDSIVGDVPLYAMGTVQTTRGCPYDCEFCDVIYLNGRVQRHKTVEQILEEIRVLRRLGVTSVSLNDDNFTGNHRWAKEVLRELARLNNSFPQPLRFSTQLSLDVAQDDELLELLADANVYQFLVGIETPNEAALRETHKLQNLRGDLVAQVHKILSYGTVVRGAMIVGFDHDEADIFETQYRFIQTCHLPSVSLHMLNAPLGTRLWRRLRAEGRVINAYAIAAGATQRLFNNVIPKRLTRVQLMQGFLWLYSKLFTWESFRQRMLGFIDLVTRPPRKQQAVEPLEALLRLGPRMGLDREACQAMEDIFRHVGQKPLLTSRVKELVIQFVRYRRSVLDFIPGLERQIELESSGKLKIELDLRPLTIPPEFRKGYREVHFPKIYAHMYRLVADKRDLDRVLMDVFLDFLTREEEFRQWEPQHLPLLYEIADRACTGLCGPAGAESRAADPCAAPAAPPPGLDEAVLNAIEQELIALAQKDRARQSMTCP
ncbi:MAG: radical SAM protein [Thermoguttaceae bacterium]|jgi:radical SAM superfamily enzyme YgiQ (UPF0313 family)